MNKDNLKKVVEILKNVDPEKFDMKHVFNTTTGKSCVIGHVYKHYHHTPELYGNQWRATEFFDRFIEEDEDALSNERTYIVNGGWADYPQTNTIEHAIHRIEKIINGYQPEWHMDEIDKEMGILN